MSGPLLRHVVLPLLFLTSTLLGGLRFAAEASRMRFVPPTLGALLLAVFLMALFARARLVDVSSWLGEERPPLENASNALTLLTLFTATAQAFNAVIPEDALFNVVFTLLFAAVFWNAMFARMRPDWLVKSLGGLFLASFIAKYVVLAGLAAPAESMTGALARALLRGVTMGALDAPAYASATGYTAFTAVALYVVGLAAASPRTDARAERLYDTLLARGLTAREERLLLAALDRPRELEAAIDAEIEEETR